MRQSAPGRIESVGYENDDILVKQLRKIYFNQKQVDKKLDKKRKFLDKWGWICSCCL